MVSSTLIRTAGIMAGIEFFITFFVSLFLCLIISNNNFIYSLIFFLSSIILFYLIYFKKIDNKINWLYYLSLIFSLISGFILLFLSYSFFLTESYLNKVSVYLLISIGFSNLLSLLLPFLTNLIIPDVILSSNLDFNQQSILYVILNMFISIITVSLISLSKTTTNKGVFNDGFYYSIFSWLIAALFGALIGYIFDSKTSPLAGSYVSNIDPSKAYDAVA